MDENHREKTCDDVMQAKTDCAQGVFKHFLVKDKKIKAELLSMDDT